MCWYILINTNCLAFSSFVLSYFYKTSLPSQSFIVQSFVQLFVAQHLSFGNFPVVSPAAAPGGAVTPFLPPPLSSICIFTNPFFLLLFFCFSFSLTTLSLLACLQAGESPQRATGDPTAARPNLRRRACRGWRGRRPCPRSTRRATATGAPPSPTACGRTDPPPQVRTRFSPAAVLHCRLRAALLFLLQQDKKRKNMEEINDFLTMFLKFGNISKKSDAAEHDAN